MSDIIHYDGKHFFNEEGFSIFPFFNPFTSHVYIYDNKTYGDLDGKWNVYHYDHDDVGNVSVEATGVLELVS